MATKHFSIGNKYESDETLFEHRYTINLYDVRMFFIKMM